MILRLLALLLLLQVSASAGDTPNAEAQHFRYWRSVSVPQGAEGQACALLDAGVFAHAAKQSLDDLRLYDAAGVEQPFLVTESGSTRFEDETAEVSNAAKRGGDIVFDLNMPNRPYTAVFLNLAAKDFVASAVVTGSNNNEVPAELGSFGLFDLSSRHLARSTELPLQESSFRKLHVTLHIDPVPGSGPKVFTASIVKNATVPPSREAQTLYTTVAAATSMTTRGEETTATIHVPAHVPVERFSFVLDPAFGNDFLRSVNVTAKPDSAQDTASLESVPGRIAHTNLPPNVTGFVANESLWQRSIDAVLGANLRTGATVDIAVENGKDAPLPLRAVQLQMRERRICFTTSRTNRSYTLRYGDNALKAPSYSVTLERGNVLATLGPEISNAGFQARVDARSYIARHPGMLSVALLAAVIALGTLLPRSSRNRH